MNKTAVVYSSTYGSTKRYAQYISKALDCDIFSADKLSKDVLLSYDTIIYGGGLYASGINGVSLITKNYSELKDKNLIIFTVGLASTEDQKIFEPIIKKNFTEGMQEKIHTFHLRGGMDYSKLSFVHGIMMKMLRLSVLKKDKSQLTEEDKMMLETYGGNVDFTDESTIEPLAMLA